MEFQWLNSLWLVIDETGWNVLGWAFGVFSAEIWTTG